MRALYGVLSHGQGHINRSAVVIDALRARGHDVDVHLVGDTAPAYAESLLGPFTSDPLPGFVLEEGRLRVGATLRQFSASLPRRRRAVRRLAARLVAGGYDRVITDFEAITARAARRASLPVVGVAGQYRITRTDGPGPRAPLERSTALLMMNAWTPGLDHYFAVSFCPARAHRRATTVIGPLVGADVRALRPTRGGFRLAYLYAHRIPTILDALRGHGPFRVYGHDLDRIIEGVQFRRSDRASFLADLAACEGVVLNGSFQAVCEAAVLGKPMLSIPFSRQYEELYNAHLVERSGLGQRAPALTRRAIGRWIAGGGPPTEPPDDGLPLLLDQLGARP